jgi:hypothetical protein
MTMFEVIGSLEVIRNPVFAQARKVSTASLGHVCCRLGGIVLEARRT